MKRWGNGRWFAGALVAVFMLVVCAALLPNVDPSPSDDLPRQVESEFSARDFPQFDGESATASDSMSGDVDELPFGGLEYEPGTVLVTLPAGVSPAQAVNAIVEETGLDGLALADERDADVAGKTAAEVPALVELSVPEGVTVQDAVTLIGMSTAIDSVQPNFVYYLNDSLADSDQSARSSLVAQNFIVQDLVTQASVNDTYIDNEWALQSMYVYGDTTGVGNAWDAVKTNQAVTVAVIDEGFQADHPDLKDNVVGTYNAVDGTSDVSETSGQKGHGTHVAGIVAATADNGIGVAGVSYNAKLLLIKGMNSAGAFDTKALAAGFDYARTHGAKVINMSIGSGDTSMEWADKDMIKAIDRATNAGVVVVCSAGNSFTDGSGKTWTPPYIDYPADYANVVSVINLKNTDSSDPHAVARSSSSNYNLSSTTESSMNTGKNISAPGTSIYSTYPQGYSSSYVVADGYGTNTGTSMASPCVAGVLALMFAVNPGLTVSEATSKLYSTATDINTAGWDRQTGYGEANAYRAVSEIGTQIAGPRMMQVGKTITLTAGSGGSWAWSSSDEGIASVANGVVTGKSCGAVRISARLVDGSGKLVSLLYQDVTVYDPTISGTTDLVYGNATVLSVPSSNPSAAWVWSSSDTSVATINQYGYLVARAPGEATVSVRLYADSSITSSVTVKVSKANLETAVMYDGSSSIEDQIYTGEDITFPNLRVYLPGYGYLTSDVYDVSYQNNRSFGEATVTVTGKGNFTGTASQMFRIGQATISGASLSGSGSYTYTGSPVTVSDLVVTSSTKETLQLGRDYSVDYSNNVNAGAASVTVTGQGNYVGELTAYFIINPKDITADDVTVSGVLGRTYTGSAQGQSPTIRYNGKTLVEGTDYTLGYSNNTNAGEATMTITGRGNFAPYTYSWNPWFGAPYVSRTWNSATTRSVSFSIAKRPVSITPNSSSKSYDGTALTATAAGYTVPGLVKDSDLASVTLGGSITNVGSTTASVSSYAFASGMAGNYSVTTKTGTLEVTQASLSSATVTLSSTSYTYDGKAKTPGVTVKVGSRTLAQGTDYAVSYSNNTAVGTATVTVTGKGNYAGSKSAGFTIGAPTSNLVQYRTHVQDVGWQGYVRDGAMSGTSGRALRLEGIQVKLGNQPYSGNIEYRTHIQNIGWESQWKKDGEMSGTSGRALRLEAIQIRLTGEMASRYDVYYRVHCQNIGWMGWARNGAQAGSAGFAYRLEGIEVKLVEKGGAAPGTTSGAFRNSAGGLSGVPDSESLALYRTHVQDDGWQNYMRDGEVSGTSGRALRLEGINVRLGGAAGSGGVTYRTHVQNVGWQGWVSDGAMSGTSGRALRLEAIEIKLTGAAAGKYDVYYRVHAQNVGWMGWAKNGESAGTAGYAYRLEAIQVRLVPKGGAAPGSTADHFRKR